MAISEVFAYQFSNICILCVKHFRCLKHCIVNTKCHHSVTNTTSVRLCKVSQCSVNTKRHQHHKCRGVRRLASNLSPWLAQVSPSETGLGGLRASFMWPPLASLLVLGLTGETVRLARVAWDIVSYGLCWPGPGPPMWESETEWPKS